jgi:Uma2 family endonuclease
MSVARKLDRPATLADLDDLPPTWRGEIIDGVLHAFPRPSAPHSQVETRVGGDLDIPFGRGRGGPGGWIILIEPSIQLPRAPEISPDIAGWRKERMPVKPSKGPITIVPDWVCEVLSPRTRRYDLKVKRPFYAEIGVRHIWYIDPEVQLLTVSRLVEGHWMDVGVYGTDEKVRAEPFEAVELDMAEWFEGFEAEEDDDAEP